jgi:tRNA pseudouridine55 synthase
LAELATHRALEQALLPLTAGLDDIPALSVTPDQARALRQGRRLAGIAATPGLLLATDGSVPVALVELSEGELRVVRGFNLD